MGIRNTKYSTQDLISTAILYSFFLLVPVLRLNLFFDSYAIKLWIVQIGLAFVSVLYIHKILQGNPAPCGEEIKKGSLYHAIKRGNSLMHSSSPKRAELSPRGGVNTTVYYLLAGYLFINLISWINIPHQFRYVALPTLISVFTYILLCFLVSQYITKPDIAILLWIIATIAVALFGLYQNHKGEIVISTLGNENFLASHLALTILITIGFFWRFLRNNKSLLKQSILLGLGIAIVLIFGTALYFTNSRGAGLGLGAGLLSFAVIAFVPQGRRFIVTIIIVLGIIALISMPICIEFTQKQLQGDVRPAIWESTLSMIGAKPLLGWGKGAYFIFYPQFRIIDYWLTRSPTNLTGHAHNEFLQILSETGIIGLIIFISLILSILRIGIKKVNTCKSYSLRYLIIGMISGTICLLSHNLVCNNLQIHSSAIFLWLTLGLILGAGSIYDPKRKNIKQPKQLLILLAITCIMAIIIWYICIKTIVAQYIFQKGCNYRLEQNWDKAIEKYEQAINWNSYDVEMHYRLAYAYAMSDQLEKAIDKYDDVYFLALDYGDIHRNKGIIYIRMEKDKLAKQNLIKARQINPYDAIALQNLNSLNKSNDK